MEKLYDKLVRDKIPQIIESEGKKPFYNKIDDNDRFLYYLGQKLLEESGEFNQDYNITELADIIEIIYKILEMKQSSFDELEEIRHSKKMARGGFDSRILLTKIEYPK
ncbi:MAG: phosphoribosyl-ATP pyrophosphohydrolase [Candidatus Thorarchaeota archaeon]